MSDKRFGRETLEHDFNDGRFVHRTVRQRCFTEMSVDKVIVTGQTSCHYWTNLLSDGIYINRVPRVACAWYGDSQSLLGAFRADGSAS